MICSHHEVLRFPGEDLWRRLIRLKLHGISFKCKCGAEGLQLYYYFLTSNNPGTEVEISYPVPPRWVKYTTMK